MSIGTNLVNVKDAVLARLQANATLAAEGVSITYHWPENPDDLQGDGGFEAIWIGDAEADIDVPLLTGGALYRDETLRLTVHVQVLKDDQADDQRDADVRAEEILTEIARTFANNVDLDPGDGTSQIRSAVLDGWKHVPGVLPDGIGHGSRFECFIEVESRLSPT